MKSRTVRYFKLIYIVAGILLSNDDICNTVDKIHIAPRVEVKEKSANNQFSSSPATAASSSSPPAQRGTASRDSEKSNRLNNALNGCWFRKLNLFYIFRKLRYNIRPYWHHFSIWTIPNYLLEYLTNLLYRKFSNDDLIYK